MLLWTFVLKFLCGHMRGNPRKTKITFWKMDSFVVQASPDRWVFWEPVWISVPAGIVVRGCIQFQWIILKILSMHLPISWWVIYKHTCSHYAECLAVFDQNYMTFMPNLPYSPNLTPSDFFFCFLRWKTSSKGKVLLMWKRWNQKWQKH